MDSIDLASQPKQKLNPNFLKKKKKIQSKLTFHQITLIGRGSISFPSMRPSFDSYIWVPLTTKYFSFF